MATPREERKRESDATFALYSLYVASIVKLMKKNSG